jgi:hypothetical protein
MRQVLLSRVVLVTFAVTMVPAGWSLFAQTPTSAVVAELQIPGADIVGLSVGENGELAVYDRTPGVSNCLMRFYVASLEDGVPVVTVAPETVTLVGNAPGFKGWMLRDGGYLYALSARNTNTDDWGSSTYERMWLYIISGRSYFTAINYNKTAVVEGDKPVSAPEDFRYAVSGFTHKPSNAESGNNLRIIIDDTLKGNLDILDFNSFGTALTSQARHSYRDRFEDGCQWPDIDPGPSYTCHWTSNSGNGLALEWTLDTRSLPSDPTLTSDDDLYLLDPLYSQSKLRRIKLSHLGGASFTAVEQAEIDLSVPDPFLLNGVESLHGAPSTDRIWIAAGLQAFDEGYVPVFDTLHLTTQIIDPVYSDENIILVDPVDNNHVIIPVADGFANPTGTLILRELQNGVVINSVPALTGFDKYSLDAAAFDRTVGLVYLAIEDTLYAVAATTPSTQIFSDGFESGNTSKWSATSK